jgi:hypothetical protein
MSQSPVCFELKNEKIPCGADAASTQNAVNCDRRNGVHHRPPTAEVPAGIELTRARNELFEQLSPPNRFSLLVLIFMVFSDSPGELISSPINCPQDIQII